MKYFLFLLLSISVLNSSFGQDSTVALSQFEMFTSQPNKILKTEIREIGTVGWRNLFLFKTTDLVSGTSASAIRVGNFSANDMPALIGPSAAYIDLSDLDSILQVLDRFVKEAEVPKPLTDIRYSYITSNDIAFTCSYDRFSDSWQYDMGKVYKVLRTYVPGSVRSFNKKRFKEFVELLKQVNTKL
jgi:hypothetical protein